ncbi:D-alanyl-D-alanine carboxypeptidase family protein [Acutalibacter sp. 1XD8-33]|uniref:D-alanyl-D-alanine carboxypeptidase family protein n=1 Tax=Acutalibacter sp. 1XD8-33 TaxID=2320081 RepID=UPI001FAA56D8|nr:D-alanyl-D-alanine carboxypeptidase family protein [Acutalibacter sp. 1XD8-33]
MKKTLALLLCLFTAALCLPALPAHGEVLEISAPAAVLMEAGTGRVLFEKNSHEARPCASITKVMTLCLTFEAIEAGQLNLSDQLSASAHAASMGGSDIWLKEGEQMSVDDLIKATVIMSANDAAVVLAENVAGSEEAFVERMNGKAQELGMEDTVFKNCNGLDEEGHITSAHDVALMSRALLTHEKITDYTLTWMDYVRDGATQLVNTNKLIRSYQGITGLKTGTTSAAGSCISATAERNGLKLIAVVLGAPSTDDRFRDAAALLDYGFAGWSVTVPESPELPPVPVTGGMEEQVEVRAGEMPEILMESAAGGEIEEKISWRENIAAPVKEGDIVGRIDYRLGSESLAQVDITAAGDVEAITFQSAFLYLLGGFLGL